MTTPTTPTGKALHLDYAPKAAGNPAGDWYSREYVQAAILAIEQEARAMEREQWLDIARQVVHYADLTADTVRAGEDLRSVMDAWTVTVEMCRKALADPEPDR